MASGHKRNNLFLDVPDKPYFGFRRGRRSAEDRREEAAPIKVLVKDGKALDLPEVVAVPPKHGMAERLKRSAPKSERNVVPMMKRLGFEHSVPLFGFVADFYHPKAQVVVEIDGPHHTFRKQRDRGRDEVFRINGIRTFRIPAAQTYGDLDALEARIAGKVRS